MIKIASGTIQTNQHSKIRDHSLKLHKLMFFMFFVILLVLFHFEVGDRLEGLDQITSRTRCCITADKLFRNTKSIVPTHFQSFQQVCNCMYVKLWKHEPFRGARVISAKTNHPGMIKSGMNNAAVPILSKESFFYRFPS